MLRRLFKFVVIKSKYRSRLRWRWFAMCSRKDSPKNFRISIFSEQNFSGTRDAIKFDKLRVERLPSR